MVHNEIITMLHIYILLKELSCNLILPNSTWSLWGRHYFHYVVEKGTQAERDWVNCPVSLSCFLTVIIRQTPVQGGPTSF